MITNNDLKEIFERLMNRFETEEEVISKLHETGEWPYSDEEIYFMGKYDLSEMCRKYPNLAEYYMQEL